MPYDDAVDREPDRQPQSEERWSRRGRFLVGMVLAFAVAITVMIIIGIAA